MSLARRGGNLCRLRQRLKRATLGRSLISSDQNQTNRPLRIARGVLLLLRPPVGSAARPQITMRSISSTVIVSAVPVVELCRLRRRVPGDLLRALERPPVRQIRRDPRRPERVAAGRRRQPRGRRTALDHGQHGAAPQRPPRQPVGPVDALKQGRLRVVEAGGVDVRRDGLLDPVVGRTSWRLSPFS